jgi:phosphoenolpyruvate carboxykinase (ATP)
MNNILNIKTPTEGQASTTRADYGLDYLGMSNLRKVYWNLPIEALYEEIIFRGEASISHQGSIVVHTGKHTGKYLVGTI